MDDRELTLKIWKTVAVVVSVLILSITGCNMHENQIGTDAIKMAFEKGVDPISAYCAIWGISDSRAAICARK